MTKEQINLSEFDFSVQTAGRTKNFKADCVASFRVRGKNRKSDSYDIALTAFMHRTDKVPRFMAVGESKFKKNGRGIVVFDNDKLEGATPLTSNKEAAVLTCASKGMVAKVFKIFGQELPNVADTAYRFYFDLEDIEGQPKVYIMRPVCLERVSADGIVSQTNFSKGESAQPNHHRFSNGR